MVHIKKLNEMAGNGEDVFKAVRDKLKVGMPYAKAETLLVKSGFKMSEYGNVYYNRQDKSYAEFNLSGERNDTPKIVVYYNFVRVPNERDSWVCGDVYDIEFYEEDGIEESRRANARGRAVNEWDETASLTPPKVIEQEDGDVTYSVMKFVESGVRPHWEECKPITGSGTYNTKQQAIDSIRRERNVTTYRIIEKHEVATVIFE